MPDDIPVRSGLPRWGVVATVDEPAALIAAWVAHHLAIGASEVHVILDRPNPEAMALMEGMDRVVLHQSGDHGWPASKRGKRPGTHQARQSQNATHVLENTTLDWLVHCDADEYLRLSAPLEEELAALDDNIEWLRIDVAERVWTDPEPGPDIFRGSFRQPVPDYALIGPALYGVGRAPLLNLGLSGHSAGKSCVRAGRGHVLTIHRPASHWDVSKCDLRGAASQNAALLHFNGMTRLQYIMKMLRRGLIMHDGLPSPSTFARKRQFEAAIANAADPAALTALWRDVQSVSADEVAALAELGVISHDGTDIVAETRARFGDRIDLGPVAFDRALVEHEADALALLALRLGFDPVPLMTAADRAAIS